MTEDYGYWPPSNWEEGADPTSKPSNAKIALGSAALLGLGLMIGRLTK